mmetsp:Transcript_98106/g.281992  ORF Transcript_98106/g.281992 Transcript_98106/m.281992 type:complete len:213 (-) Transcript_98106:582-1220(-)
MDDLPRVDVAQSIHKLEKNVLSLHLRQAAIPLDVEVQVTSLNELHDQVEIVLRLPNLIQGDDVLVTHREEDLRFSPQLLRRALRVPGELVDSHDLDRERRAGVGGPEASMDRGSRPFSQLHEGDVRILLGPEDHPPLFLGQRHYLLHLLRRLCRSSRSGRGYSCIPTRGDGGRGSVGRGSCGGGVALGFLEHPALLQHLHAQRLRHLLATRE